MWAACTWARFPRIASVGISPTKATCLTLSTRAGRFSVRYEGLMKIMAFTAGAAQMYCGSCIRDNALAAELKSQGHDIILLPIYTPTLTDETNVAAHKVFFGGISVYLEQHSGLFRSTPWLLDRLWDSEWALKLAARRSIPVNPHLLGEMTVSMLRGEDGRQRKEIHKLAAWLRSRSEEHTSELQSPCNLVC